MKAINTNFLPEWKPYDEIERKVKFAMFHVLSYSRCMWQPTNDRSSMQVFEPRSIEDMETMLGLAYTSSSDYAALWLCNAGYLHPYNRVGYSYHGFAVNTDGDVIGVAWDKDENEIFINLSIGYL